MIKILPDDDWEVIKIAERKALEADCEMKDKRIDWTVADNVKKAIRIEQLEGAIKLIHWMVGQEGIDNNIIAEDVCAICDQALDSKEQT